MRIVLTARGSAGDVQPFIALAADLRRHGHQPVFALPKESLPYARRLDLEAIQLGPDLSEQFLRVQRHRTQGLPTDEVWTDYLRALFASVPRALAQLQALCANADVLVSAAFMPLGRMVHDLIGIPFVSIEPCTSYPLEFPHAVFSPADHPLNKLLTQMGLPPSADPEMYGFSPQLHIFGVSNEFMRRDPRWPSHYHVVGIFFLDEDAWQPPPALESFLQAGPPPIVISFSSAMCDDPKGLTQLFLAAIESAGCRAVIQSGWSGLAKDMPLPPSVYAADYVPHCWLFPRAACVVNHGGGMTIWEAIRDGVPVVPIPFDAEKFATATQVRDLGCAPPPIRLKELTVDNLSAAIRDVLGNPRYRRAAAAVGDRVRAEQGVQTTRALIEQFVATRPRVASD